MTNNRDDEFDFREVKDGEESEVVDTTTDSAASDDKSDNTSNNNEEKTEYEDVCFVCRRPESKAGKMFHLPNNICICNDLI